MNQDQEKLEALIAAWLDETISEQDSATLQDWLRQSASARETFRRYATLDASLRQMADVELESTVAGQDSLVALASQSRRRHSKTVWLFVAVCVAGMLVVPLGVMLRWESSIATITGVSGPLRWTGDAGMVTHEVKVGQQLTGGTIDGLSPESWFELQFHDGSSITLSGNSMLTFADHGQKVLHLKSGKFSANVNPQPSGRPMLVHTRSATLTVLGTSFDVEAALPATVVKVTEGTVQVARTGDGKQINVPANHRVVAAVDRKLKRELVPTSVDAWHSSLAKGPDETFGEWVAARETDPASLKAVAFVPENEPSIVLHLLGMSVRSDLDSPVLLKPTSRWIVHGRMDVKTNLYLGFSVAKRNGDFAGKFLAPCKLEKHPEGGFVATADLKSFVLDPSVEAFRDKLPESPVNLVATGVWCFTHSETPSGLRVFDVSLEPSDDSSP